MILEVPQLQVIDRLRDYSSCAGGVRVQRRARWCVDTSLWAASVLSHSVVLLFVRRDVVWWRSFSPDGAYDSVWDSVKPMTGNTSSIISSTQRSLGVFSC